MMRRMHPLAICSAAAIALALGTGAASAEDKTFELKLSHWVPPTHPLQKAIEQWGADVEQASGGTIKYKVFPSQQLGKAFDHYDMARDGIADFTYVNPGYQPGRFPIIAAGELPFMVGDAHGGIRAVDAWYRKYAATEMKDVKYCFSFILDPLTWHSKTKKIMRPCRPRRKKSLTITARPNGPASSPTLGPTSSIQASRRSGPNRDTRSIRFRRSSWPSGKNRPSRCNRNGPAPSVTPAAIPIPS